MIYTTYFAQLRNLPESITPVSIAGKAPDWYKGFEYKLLAPKYDFFAKWKENHDNDYYIKCYKEQVLDKLTPWKIIYHLGNMINSADIEAYDFALVCYERPDEFCHRHLVAEWLRNNGYKCEEWSKL